MRPSFFDHLHPPTIPAPQARFRYTLSAGGFAVFLTLVLGITGILEMFYYIPTPDQAGSSIQTLTFLVPFGGLVRNLHFWSAQLLVIIVVLHLLRVIFTGAYLPPRRFNYLLGMSLLVSCLLMDLTGYILRWDQGIHWALVTGANLIKSIPLIGSALYIILVGGSQPGSATLIRFYGWHIFGLTLVGGVILVWHLFRIRRDGGIAVPPPLKRESLERISRYELVKREVLAMLLASITLLLLAAFVPAPLAPPITETSTNYVTTRAPWFFLWIQEMLKQGSPFLWGVVIPLTVLAAVTLIPYIFPKPTKDELGKWFPRHNRLAQIFFILILLVIGILTIVDLLPVS